MFNNLQKGRFNTYARSKERHNHTNILPTLTPSILLLFVFVSFPLRHLCRIPKVRLLLGGRRGAATETSRGTPLRPRPLGR